MKLSGLFTALAIGALCTFGAAHAQVITNTVSLNLLLIPGGPTNTDDGTNFLYVPEKSSSLNSAGLLKEIGLALHAEKGANLTTAARLVLITGNGSPEFGVVDGTNFYALTNIMMMFMPVRSTILAGTQNGQTGLAFPTIKTVETLQVSYLDYQFVGAQGFSFTMQGIASISMTDTTPESGTGLYTQTLSGRLTSLSGSGSESNTFLFATGTMSFSGKGTAVWQPK